jgi:hypothetical protein
MIYSVKSLLLRSIGGHVHPFSVTTGEMMKNTVNHIFKLIKAAYYYKINIRKCLKQDKNSQVYRVAKLYDAYFRELEEGEVSMENICVLEDQINQHRVENQGSENIQQLLEKILLFLEELKPFVKQKMA